MIHAKPLLKEIPVVVISAENPSEKWKQRQQLLAKLTNKTEHIQTKSGHSVHLEEPEIVIDSILRLVKMGYDRLDK